MRAEEEAKKQAEDAARREKDDAEKKERDKEREERLRLERERRQKEMLELEALEADLKKKQTPEPIPGNFNILFKRNWGSPRTPIFFFFFLDDFGKFFAFIYFVAVGDGLSVEDFESTLAELQSFIDGDVFTSLGGEVQTPGATPGKIKSIFLYLLLKANTFVIAKPSVKAEQEQQVALAPLPAAKGASQDGIGDEIIEAPETTPLKADCIENYDVDEEVKNIFKSYFLIFLFRLLKRRIVHHRLMCITTTPSSNLRRLP